MEKIQRNIIGIIVLAAVGIVAYTIGKTIGSNNAETKIIENYSVVKTIAELATLEVSGNTTFKTTNVSGDESWWNSMSAFFTEKSATITVPYQAKYGVDVSADSVKIEKQDSVVIIHLPKAKLLSYELRIDRMETANRKGLLVFSDDEFYTGFQKKLYAQSRQQMEGNAHYLRASQARIDSVLQQYYRPFGLQAKCVFQ